MAINRKTEVFISGCYSCFLSTNANWVFKECRKNVQFLMCDWSCSGLPQTLKADGEAGSRKSVEFRSLQDLVTGVFTVTFCSVCLWVCPLTPPLCLLKQDKIIIWFLGEFCATVQQPLLVHQCLLVCVIPFSAIVELWNPHNACHVFNSWWEFEISLGKHTTRGRVPKLLEKSVKSSC